VIDATTVLSDAISNAMEENHLLCLVPFFH